MQQMIPFPPGYCLHCTETVPVPELLCIPDRCQSRSMMLGPVKVPTCAIAPYSTITLTAFIPKTVQIAAFVDRLSKSEINTGASNLQKRSMRLIDAFNSSIHGQFRPAKLY